MDADATPRFRHVCCCIDDVRHAGPSIAEAHRLAGDPDRVSVVHVAPQAAVLLGGLSEWGEVDPEAPLAVAETWLAATARATGGGRPVVLSGAPAADTAVAWARASGVDLIVCSARAGGLRHQVLGSFAARLAVDAPCPVLLLPPSREDDGWPPSPPVGPYRHIAAVVDDTAGSALALDAVERRSGEARIDVVALRNPLRRLRDAVGLIGRGGVAHDRRVLTATGGRPAVRLGGLQMRALGAWARQAGVDLLVVAGGALVPTLLARVGRLAAEGTCSVLVLRGGPYGPADDDPWR